MPKVPVIDQTAVGAQPFTAPGVAPVRNYAPEQMGQLANATEQAGSVEFRTGQTIGDRIAAQVDDAKTKQAETAFLQTTQDILYHPEKGYFRQQGQAAVQAYQPTKDALNKAAQDGLSGLDNSIQKQMFQQVAQQHLLSMGGKLADYNHSQSVAWSASESKARADSYQLQAVQSLASRYQVNDQGEPTGDFAKYKTQGEAEVLNSAKLAGFDADSAQAKAMLTEYRTGMNHAIISNLLDSHDAAGAKKWFDEQSAAGNIDLRNLSSLGNAVKTQYDQQKVIDTTDEIMAASLHPAPVRNEYMVEDNPKGLVEKGNLPIWNRPSVQNADGSHSTEYSTSFGDEKGREILVPTIVNGKFLTPDGKMPREGSPEEKAMFIAAQKHYEETGEHLGIFNNPNDAEAYAQKLHSREEEQPVKRFAPVTLAMPVPGSSINITGQMGDPRANGRKHDGIDIAVPVGTTVMAPAAGKVIKVWNDEQFGGGLSVQVQLQNGYTAGFAHLSAANVHVGDEVPQGTQLGLSGKTGNATGPTLHYAMRDPDGKYVDPRQVSQPQPNPQGFSDPSALERSLQLLAGRDDLTSRQKLQVEANLRSQHSAYREIDNQKLTDLTKQADEAFYKGGENASAIPPSLMMQLPAEKQQAYRDKQREKVTSDYNYGQFLKNSSETDIVSDFYANPKMVTVDNVEAARGQLSRGTYLSLMNRAGEQAKNPQGVVEASNVEDRIRHFAAPAGIIVDPKNTADKQKLNDLRYSVSNAIDAIKRQNNGKATAAQVDEAIKQQVIQHTVSVKAPWYSFNSTTDVQRYSYQMPAGAVGVAPGSDKQMHYHDAAGRDLGVAQ